MKSTLRAARANSIVFGCLPAFCLAVSLGAPGCDGCDEEFEYLSLSIGSKNLKTTPKWGGTWQHSTGAFEAEASWGPSDPAPTADAFELYDVTAAEARKLVMAVVDCRVGDGTQHQDNACSGYYAGGSCPFAARRWSYGPVEAGRDYLLVHRLSQGNGRKLSSTGPLDTFAGEAAYTMKLSLASPD